MSLRQRMEEGLIALIKRASGKTYLTSVLSFGFKYLRPYLRRFVGGILLGILFGALNGLFVSATTLLVVRVVGGMDGNPSAQMMQSAVAAKSEKEKAAEAPSALSLKLKEYREALAQPFLPLVHRLQQIAQSIKSTFHSIYTQWIDPWMLLSGRPWTWQQAAGSFLLLPILAALRGGVGYASSYCMAWTSQRVVTDLKADVFYKLNTLSLDFFNKTTISNIMARVNSDTAALNGALRLGLSDLVKEPITVICVFAALLVQDWRLTLMAVVFVPLMVIPIRTISKKIRSYSRSTNELDIQQGSLLIDSFINIRIVQAFGLQQQQTHEFLEQNRRGLRLGMRTLQAKEILNPIVEAFAAIGISAVIVFVVISGRSAANLFGFIIALGIMYTPFKKLAGIHLYFVQSEVPLKRLMELFSLEPTVRDAPNPAPFRHFDSSIRLRDVSFHYNEERPVLRRVNIDVPCGKKIGLAGESGSGKSSLINLLFRFYDPTSGVIELDGTDIRKISLQDLRQHMALVSQDALLFNVSVAENIGYGKIGATREEIIEAAKHAYAHEFIMAMPNGYDTMIGERGSQISGGQRQRLAIARAFVRNAPILVLDEATASLDSQAEAEVQAAIDRLANGRTVVCIAHRLSTLTTMDNIYVMKDGEVIESGGFEELLQRGGAFATMAKRQSIQSSLPA